MKNMEKKKNRKSKHGKKIEKTKRNGGKWKNKWEKMLRKIKR